MSAEETKVKCQTRRCGWSGTISGVLKAPNPFEDGEVITGCPLCKSVDSMVTLCDELHCTNEATCGTPTASGYRTTCGKHMPKSKDKTT